MSWPRKEEIKQGVIDMLRVNMALKAGEKLLIISDLPHVHHWQTIEQENLADMLERAMLGRLIADIVKEHFTDLDARFLPFPATGGHGHPEPQHRHPRRHRGRHGKRHRFDR